jgi:hypothetical protein
MNHLAVREKPGSVDSVEEMSATRPARDRPDKSEFRTLPGQAAALVVWKRCARPRKHGDFNRSVR